MATSPLHSNTEITLQVKNLKYGDTMRKKVLTTEYQSKQRSKEALP
jgi:hypothetical protein